MTLSSHMTFVRAMWNRSNLFPHPSFLEWSPKNTEFQVHLASLSDSAPALRPRFYLNSINNDATSESQCHVDKIVSKMFPNGNGFFIDLAANDYKSLSNTYYLEQRYGWNGVCIEPNPEYLQNLLAFRKCITVINPISEYSNENVTFRLSETAPQGNFLYSAFGGIVSNQETVTDIPKNNAHHALELSLSTATLLNLLNYIQAPSVIEYFNLDVEGAEYYVLKHFDFGRYRFFMLSIERPKKVLHQLLVKHDYWYYTPAPHCNFGDLLYIHISMPNFHYLMKQEKENRNRRDGDWLTANSYVFDPVYTPDVHNRRKYIRQREQHLNLK